MPTIRQGLWKRDLLVFMIAVQVVSPSKDTISGETIARSRKKYERRWIQEEKTMSWACMFFRSEAAHSGLVLTRNPRKQVS